MNDEFDDIVASLREAAAELVAQDAEDGIVRPGAVVLVLMDLPLSPDEHEPLVRGVYGTFEDAAGRAFLHECQRLEIPLDEVAHDVPSLEDFERVGQSAAVAAAGYVCADHGGDRVLVLLMGVLRG